MHYPHYPHYPPPPSSGCPTFFLPQPSPGGQVAWLLLSSSFFPAFQPFCGILHTYKCTGKALPTAAQLHHLSLQLLRQEHPFATCALHLHMHTSTPPSTLACTHLKFAHAQCHWLFTPHNKARRCLLVPHSAHPFAAATDNCPLGLVLPICLPLQLASLPLTLLARCSTSTPTPMHWWCALRT